jgi:hypothetical protein
MSLDVYLSPNKCPHCGRADEGFSQNITHNLNKMADEAGIYGVVWCPEENGITTARQLIEPLRKAIADMKADPERFKKHNASNGWGLYENFLPWLEKYLQACEEMPDAAVSVSR